MHTNHLKSAFEGMGASGNLESIKSALHVICNPKRRTVHTNHLKSAFEGMGASDDLVNIKSALYIICSEFGIVSRLDVLPARQGDKHQALCFLRMENAEHEQKIMRFLEVVRFAGDLVVVVDLPFESPAPRMSVAQPVGVPAMA